MHACRAREGRSLDEIDPRCLDPAALPQDDIAYQHSAGCHDVWNLTPGRLPSRGERGPEKYGVQMHHIEAANRLAKLLTERGGPGEPSQPRHWKVVDP